MSRGLQRSIFFVGGFLALVSIEAQAVFTQAEKLADYRQLVTTVEQNYAPIRWKQRTVALDWSSLVEKYRDQVKRTSSDLEFYQTLAKFLAELKDAHVSVSVPSSLQANLGFLCDYLNGKVLIDDVNLKILPQELFPFKKGDQLLAIGGVPVEQLMAEIQQLSSTGYEKSSKRLAAAYLTFRRESRALTVPKGITTVTVLPAGEDKPVTVSVAWVNKGDPILDMGGDFSPGFEGRDLLLPSLLDRVKGLSLFDLGLSKELVKDFKQAGLKDLGAATSMFALPSDAQQIPMVPFTAVTFTRNGKRVGILRIPEYGDDSFAAIIGMSLVFMQKNVDVLVLDQTNNPGGQVSTVSTIMSFFAQSSARDASFAVRPSRNWLDKFQSINQTIAQMLEDDPADVAANALQPRFQYLERLMRDSLQNGVFLTAPFSLDMTGALGSINPNPQVSFTKPVLMLINEFDFSGGDVFPALMKDNGRATLFGTRTTGAGGNVGEYGPLTNSFFKFHLTESLIVRPNGELIENLGVEPNIKYEITEKDFNDGYQDYSRAFLCEALKLVDTACSGDLLAAPVAPVDPTVPAAPPSADPHP